MKLLFSLIRKSDCFASLLKLSSTQQTIVGKNIPTCCRSMSEETKSSTTHLERTETSPRLEVISDAIVTEISHLSQTVKSLSFKMLDKSFTFKPGQWVDFFIPGVSTVGGFSICSTPKQLRESHCMQLAVKFSNHPPAFWVHQQCKVGDRVKMRVGGDFYYHPPLNKSVNDNLLLIAGGVGINPLYSIIQHVADVSDTFNGDKGFSGKCRLLFSAKNRDELLFQDSLLRTESLHPRVSCKYFITGVDSIKDLSNDNDKFCCKRISEKDVADALAELNHQKLLVYICGPPPMIQDMLVYLKNLGVASNRVKYEKWW